MRHIYSHRWELMYVARFPFLIFSEGSKVLFMICKFQSIHWRLLRRHTKKSVGSPLKKYYLPMRLLFIPHFFSSEIVLYKIHCWMEVVLHKDRWFLFLKTCKKYWQDDGSNGLLAHPHFSHAIYIDNLLFGIFDVILLSIKKDTQIPILKSSTNKFVFIVLLGSGLPGIHKPSNNFFIQELIVKNLSSRLPWEI